MMTAHKLKLFFRFCAGAEIRIIFHVQLVGMPVPVPEKPFVRRILPNRHDDLVCRFLGKKLRLVPDIVD